MIIPDGRVITLNYFMLKLLKAYTFEELEKFLVDWDNIDKCLIVKNEPCNITAIMHVCQESVSASYRSGDGILFYRDGDIKSADDDDEFTLLQIISF